MDIFVKLFSGIGTFFVEDPKIAIARLLLIILGFILAWMGFRRKLEPLIMVPMGLGMIAVNAGVLFLAGGQTGTLILDPMVSDPTELVNLMQINFLQPVYNFTFSNGLIACIVFFGIGAMSDISFILLRPWASIIVALFAEAGTFAALLLGIEVFGLPANEAASIAIIAYLYLSLTYAGYPYLVRLMVPKKYRGMEVDIDYPTVSKKAKFIFTICACLLLCLLLPVAAPLILSFFLGIAIKEAEIEPFQKLLESTMTYTATLFLGLLLGTLCEAQTILDPKVGIILILGIGALAISAVGALLGGWFIWFISKGRYNPAIGIAGVSCLPTTAKIAQKEVSHENPYAVILPLAMGAGVSGLIVSAIATGIFISTLFLLK